MSTLYCAVADVAAELGQVTGDRDARVEAAITAASRQIDGRCGRRFYQDDDVTAREFYATSYTCLDSEVDQVLDISTTVGLVVKTDTGDNGGFATSLTIGTNFILLPVNAADDAVPYTTIRLVDGSTFPMSSSGRPGVQVAAKHGWATVPDPVKRACILQAVQLYKGADAVFGGLSFGDGSFLRVRAGLNPIADALVAPYAFPRVG